jgi:PAS domain S-box-containing protein
MPIDTPRISSRLDILYFITRELNADLEINQLLYNMLSATVASVGASDASLFLFDSAGNLEHSLLISGFEVQKPSQATMQLISEQGLTDWVRRYRKGVVIKDTNVDERWYADDFTLEIGNVGSAIAAPIQLPDQLIGILTITTPQVNYFDESDLAMLTIIADQAAFAIANARLFEAEQQRRRLADTLTSTAHTVNSTLDLSEVLSLILEQLSLVVDYDSSSILLYDPNDQSLAVQAARGFEDMEDALNFKLPFDENIPNYRAIIQKKPLVITDVDTEPHWIRSSSSQKVRSWIGAPLIARDEVVGILTVDSYELNKYAAENASVVATFADQAATAVANAQAVTRLQNAEASYAALFEDSTDMIIITNYQGIILDVNRKACQMMRRPKEAFIEFDIGFIARRLKDYLTGHTKHLRAWGEGSIEVEVTDAYRKIVPLEVKVRQIQFRGKACVEWVGRDISARKEMERMRQDLIHMLVHDLRGPLGNLINTIELVSMLMGPKIDNPNLKNILDMAKRSGQTITDLIDSMLDVNRLEQGEVPLQRSMTRLDELIQAVEEQVIVQATSKQMALIIHPLPESAEVWIDHSLIRRVLINLVGNAIKYTPEEGHVSLMTSLNEDTLHFVVSDDGPGISQADQAHIFDKFSRVDYSVNTVAGVGLGLAFCKLAIEAHGGTITVESEGIPGEGSAFHVTLPVIKKPDEPVKA